MPIRGKFTLFPGVRYDAGRGQWSLGSKKSKRPRWTGKTRAQKQAARKKASTQGREDVRRRLDAAKSDGKTRSGAWALDPSPVAARRAATRVNSSKPKPMVMTSNSPLVLPQKWHHTEGETQRLYDSIAREFGPEGAGRCGQPTADGTPCRKPGKCAPGYHKPYTTKKKRH